MSKRDEAWEAWVKRFEGTELDNDLALSLVSYAAWGAAWDAAITEAERRVAELHILNGHRQTIDAALARLGPLR